jgi:hypothetical protein
MTLSGRYFNARTPVGRRRALPGKRVTAKSRVNSIAMAGRLARDHYAEGIRSVIRGLMLLPGGNLDPFPFFEDALVMFDLHGEFAFEHIKKLAGVDVGVAGFAGICGHQFFDDAEIGGFDQVPAVAVGSPFIMFGGFYADYFCGHRNGRINAAW